MWLSFFTCPKTLICQDMIASHHGIDHTRDTSTSACEIGGILCDINNYKEFSLERWIFSNCMGHFLIWFPCSDTFDYFGKCNTYNNSQYSSGA